MSYTKLQSLMMDSGRILSIAKVFGENMAFAANLKLEEQVKGKLHQGSTQIPGTSRLSLP